MRTTAETMVKLLARTDRKRWSFFRVKRTTGHKFAACPAQRYPSIDDLDKIDPAE